MVEWIECTFNDFFYSGLVGTSSSCDYFLDTSFDSFTAH